MNRLHMFIITCMIMITSTQLFGMVEDTQDPNEKYREYITHYTQKHGYHLIFQHDAYVTSAAFSYDDVYLITTSGKQAKVWDIAMNDYIMVLEHNAGVFLAQFSHCGNYVLTATKDNRIHLWNLTKTDTRWDSKKDCACELTIQSKYPITSISFSPCDTKILITLSNGMTEIWDLKTKKIAHCTQCATPIKTAQWFFDGSCIILVYEGDIVRIYNINDIHKDIVFDNTSSAILSMCGNYITLVHTEEKEQNSGSSIEIWDINNKNSMSYKKTNKNITTAALNPFVKKKILATFFNGTAGIFDLKEDEIENTNVLLQPYKFFQLDQKITSAQYSHMGTFILTIADDCTATLWLA